jgi:hypothetical protein
MVCNEENQKKLKQEILEFLINFLALLTSSL